VQALARRPQLFFIKTVFHVFHLAGKRPDPWPPRDRRLIAA